MAIWLVVLAVVSAPSNYVTSTIDPSIKLPLPLGHMEPLGSHRPPETNLVDDLQEMPSPREFWTKYVRPSRAVVLRGAAKHGRAFTEWTDKYLKERFHDLEVRLEGKKEKSSVVPKGAKGVGRDTIGNFIDHYHNKDNNLYVVSELPTPMWHDVTVIPPLSCGLLKDRLVEVDLWMSGGGTKSILHKDAFNAINCLYNGTKEWKMIEYKYEDKIYKAWEPPEMIGGFSRINVQNVDLLKYPKVAEVPWSFVTINAGDCLFLPKSYYHQVTSYGTNNVAVSLLFARLDRVDDIDFTGCDQQLSYKPLSEMDMDWKYSGHGNLSMGNTDLETIRSGLLELFGEEDQLNEATLETNMKEVLGKPFDAYSYIHHIGDLELVKKILDLLDVRGKGYVSREQIKNLSRDEMRKFALSFEGTDVSNTEDAEYGVVIVGDISAILKRQLDDKGHVDKEKFIQDYQEVTGGTQTYAEKLFEKLRDSTSPRDQVTSEEVQRNFRHAVQRYLDWGPEVHIPPGQDRPEPNDAYIEDDETSEPVETEGAGEEAEDTPVHSEL